MFWFQLCRSNRWSLLWALSSICSTSQFRFTNLYPSGQNNETLLADTCRKNNFPHKQTIFYYPDFNLEYYSGVPFKTIEPTPSTHTTVRGNVTTLSDLLFSLHYSPENTYVVPPERILHVCYRIDLAGGHVDSSAGRTELTQDQIARICEIIDSIWIPFPVPRSSSIISLFCPYRRKLIKKNAEQRTN